MPEPQTITETFAQQVSRTPDRIAISDERRSLSYRELDRLSNNIANRLPTGAQFIGLVVDHGVEMIASILAILKTGAAYVPTEPTFPPERIRYVMSECGAEAVITQQCYAGLFTTTPLIFVEQGTPLDADASHTLKQVAPNDLAYVLYTSGTTGYPKGVAVEHHNVCNYASAFQNEFHPTEDDVILQNSVCSFDIFVEEVFPVLLSGGHIAIPDAATRNDLRVLVNFVEKNHVTIISGFPYLLNDLNKLGSVPASVRLLISGGDVLKASYVSTLIEQTAVYNTYGPSETTVCATYFHCNGYPPLEDGTYPVGKAVSGVSVRLLDGNLQPVAPDQIGEICISGNGVARGYLNPDIPDNGFQQAADGERLYRSGDLGYMLADGNLVFIKRKDEQVMILGRRVEPQEVEHVISRNEAVDYVVVSAHEDESGLAYLTAYLVPRGKGIRISELRAYLARHLPDYMIPEFFVMLEQMPLNANGKVDRRALPVVLKDSGLT